MIGDIKRELDTLADIETTLNEAAGGVKDLATFQHRMSAAFTGEELDYVDEPEVEDFEEVAETVGNVAEVLRGVVDGPLATLIDEARDLATYCRDLFDSFDPSELGPEDVEAKRLTVSLLRQLPIGVDPEASA